MTREKSKPGCLSGCLRLFVFGLVFFIFAAILLRDHKAPPKSTQRQEVSSPEPVAKPVVHEFDIIRSTQLRSGPGLEHDLKINHKASDKLGKIEYLSIDTSTTVRILQSQGDWIEIQVTQPDFLRNSHQGWVPKEVIKNGQSTDKLNGWIRSTCRVYLSPNPSSSSIGYLSPPSAVSVADDGSGWLRLLHGPIKDETTNKFIDTKFDSGLYIEKSKFTTELPAKWKR